LAPVAQRLEDTLGEAAGLAVSALREVEGVLEFRNGRIDNARSILAGGTRLARVAGQPSQTVSVLTALADAGLAAGDRAAAHSALAEARGIVDEEPVYPAIISRLEEAETRLGRSAIRAARDQRVLLEELTDRELSILRALRGPLTQREIGRELFLSINTIKGYTKSLYRKLDVVSRRDAVERGRQLGLI
jgi:LuxR family transcriptional regulator, maltose regulon positive regulatory protein